MIKRVIPLVALVLSGTAFAQIGIGTPKAADVAQLDIVATDRGVLIPRIQLTALKDQAPIKGDMVESLLVYNTGSSTLEAGFYYWKANAWTRLLSGDSVSDRKNNTFAIAGNPNKNGEESLVITDTENSKVYLAITEIANNSTFVTNLAKNTEFISKVTKNEEFVTNIIQTLNDKYGNVGYENGNFFYIDANGKHAIEIEDLNTTNKTFALVNDELVVTDSEGNSVKVAVAEIANNETFVTNLANNETFISKVTNNEEFVTNIITTLNDKYGNVGYENGNFFYIDANGKHIIEIEDLNTTNKTFALVNDELVVTDSEGNSVKMAVAEIANNETFVTNLAGNHTFVTKLGDNAEFISKVTNNEEFVTNIIQTLNDKYGNVGYENGNFFYIDANGKHAIEIEDLNTTNKTFALVNDELVVTDSEGNSVKMAVAEIANNETFVTNLANNETFISKVTNNEEFVTNIITTLNDKYGNVGYENGNFFYVDVNGKHAIEIEDLNTTNKTFALVNDELVVTDSEGNSVKMAVAEIANNETFVTNLANNETFISKVTKNEEFVTNIITTLNEKYGNVGYENGNFFYVDANGKHAIAIEDLNTTNKTFALVNDELVVTDSEGNSVKVAVAEIANNETFLTNLANNETFISKVTNNEEFVTNIITTLNDKYGNVGYENGNFFYIDANGKHAIAIEDLNTTNKTFALVNDELVVTDSEGNSVKMAVAEIANNETFVTNLAGNHTFVTKLGDNAEFISKVTNNEEFVTNIITTLNEKYGNVGYENGNFFYVDANGKHAIEIEDLNTTNKTFALVNDELVVTDSEGNSVKVAVAEIANNETFVTNLANNETFISKVTKNEEFVTNIIQTLNDKYGNVGYENGNFFYIDANGKHAIEIEDLNTTNKTFALVNDELVVTDSEGNSVKVAVAEIANNETFVTNLANNETFISKVTNNEEFVTNIITTLNDKYGNVGYENGNFFYVDVNGKHAIEIEDLNTTNKTFALVNDELMVTDSEGNSVKVAVAEIANNETFVTNLAGNHTFVTKLGDNAEFISKVTKNEEFVTNIIQTLNDKYGNVGYENGNFFYIDANGKHAIEIEDLNTTNKTFALVNDELVVTDSEGNSVKMAVAEIANNETFVTNLANNETFISKVTKNEEFVTNIIQTLNEKYGNVGYENGNFFYIDANGKHEIAIEDLNTTNKTFALVNDELVVTDSEGNSVKVAVAEIANNETFVTNLAGNHTFVTKLGDNAEFISKVTKNEEFVTNIIQTLNDKYGNVGYENGNFFYIDANGKHAIEIEDLNTTNKTFALVNDELVVTDSEGNSVKVAVAEIANNETFVTNLAGNHTFVTKLGDNAEFISKVTKNEEFVTNIIQTLNDKYGNVGYENGNFFYIDANGKHAIAIEDLNTTNKTFALVNDELVVTDSEGNSVKVAVAEIANNETFVTNLAGNHTFVTTLGDNTTFKNMVTANSVVADLKLLENVSENAEIVKGRFQFNNGKNETDVHFSETLTAMEKGTDAEGKSEYYFIDETGGRDQVVIQVTQDVISDFNKIIEDDKVKELLTGLIQKSEGSITITKDTNGHLIIKTTEGEFNLTDEIKANETNTVLTSLGAGVYVYKNEEVMKDATLTGVTINVVADVKQNFEDIMKDSEVKTILNQYIANGFDGNVTYKNGDFYVTQERDNTFVTEKLEFKSLLEASSESLTTDGVIGVTTSGEVGTEAEKAVLKAVRLSLNSGTVTTEHIKDGTLLATDLANAGKNQVLVTGADQKPVWKDQSKVTPQFFYMPAVIFDTTETGTATRDLYQDYVNQFTGGTGTYAISHGPAGTTPMQYGGGVVGSAGAPAKITVFESSELYYYVTYYDEAVFENITISAEGKLTYTVKATAEASSFMNIVFVIK